MIVYTVTSPSGRRYIGITKYTLEYRKTKHKSAAKFYGVTGTTITNTITKQRPSSKGLSFKWYDGKNCEPFNYSKKLRNKMSQQAKNNISNSRPNKRKITDNFGVTYNSIVEASKITGIKRTTINNLLRSSRELDGWSFSYVG